MAVKIQSISPSLLLLMLVSSSISSFIIYSTPAAAAAAGDKRPNKSFSGGGIVWATSPTAPTSNEDHDEHHQATETMAGFLRANSAPSTDEYEDDVALVQDDSAGDDALDGGFSSLEGMLQWAIGHSDPEKLKEKASDVQRSSTDELRRRQLEIKELMEKLKMPSDAELMQIAIRDLTNSSLSLEERERALNELLVLVEPIDNANDLDKLGGLVAVIRELSNSKADIRKLSAWILGKASQNNMLVQKQILAYDVLPKLMNMVHSSSTEEAIKALYAISALIRNNDYGQELFSSENGGSMLQDILSNPTIDIRLQKKAVFLVADLVNYHLEKPEGFKLQFLSSQLFLKSVVNSASSSDLDLQEKALLAIRSLLKLSYIDASILKEYCGLDTVLDRLRERLERLMADDEQKDYANDVENLRKEVYMMFHRKLEQDFVYSVPT